MKRKALKKNSGLTLLEVMLAVFLLAVIALPVLNQFMYSTMLVRIAKDKGDTTYAMQAVMEDLKPLDYDTLYASFNPKPGDKYYPYQLKLLGSTQTVTKQVLIDRLPYGSFENFVSGEACYAHLILSGSSASLTCPDGKRHNLSSISAISFSATKATAGENTCNLNKPAGTTMILIIHAGSTGISGLTVNLNNTAACVVYALSPDDAVKQTITVNGAITTNGVTALREYRKYNTSSDEKTKDPLPCTLLVKAVCKSYGKDDKVESIEQGVLQVKLP